MTLPLSQLRTAFGDRLQELADMRRYTAARLGGPADALIEVNSVEELAQAAGVLWELEAPFIILGGGSNVLVSDHGVRGVIVLNRARRVRFNEDEEPPTAWAESGANLGMVARQSAGRGLPGLEWAAGIPGTIGGAVVGNAGAHGSDISSNLLVAEILQLKSYNALTGAGRGVPVREEWPVERLEYSYRSSRLKNISGKYVVLSALLKLGFPESRADVQARIDAYTEYRHRTQPPGASMGSMFKNPPGDYAGRLIEAAGLKGTRIGGAQISPLHANFFINYGQASASDVYALIIKAQEEVASRFGVALELEVELIGDW